MEKKPDEVTKSEPSLTAPEEPTAIAVRQENAIDSYVSAGTVAKVAGIIVAIAYIFSAGPIAGPVVALIAIAALFAPEVFAAEEIGELSAKMLEQIYEELDAALLANALSQANAAVTANMKVCDEVTADFNVWISSNNATEKEARRTRLQAHYIALTREYAADLLRDFTRDDFRGALLPQYVLCAARYLKVMQSFYKYANELGLAARGIFFDVQEAVLVRLRRDIAEFTDTAITSYNNGLQKIVNGTGHRARTWGDFNDYRNTSTVTALDLVATFIYADPGLYPAGCHIQTLTRKLLTVLEIDYFKAQRLSLRGDILAADDSVNFLRPVMLIRQMRLSSGNFFVDDSVDVIDGLYASQCVLKSVDGHEFLYSPAVTGITNPGTSGIIRPRKDPYIGNTCFGVRGYYWNRSKPVFSPGAQLPLRTIFETMATMDFIHAEPDNRARVVDWEFTPLATDMPSFTAFNQSISGILDRVPLTSSGAADRLVEFDILPNINSHNYLLSWRHEQALQDLLPEKNHVANVDQNPVAQFHAIKAGKSIRQNGLEIVKGPGFTGGDLVALHGGDELTFFLKRHAARWFAGAYAVRLWFVNVAFPGQSLDVAVSAVPGGGFTESKVSAIIAASNQRPDISNLKFGDLSSHTFDGTLLLAAAMPEFTLKLNVNSLTTAALVDRIELIFVRPASMHLPTPNL